MKTQIDDFTKGYITCALWSETDENEECLDAVYSIEDITEESIQLIIAECKTFQDENKALLNQYYDLYKHWEYTSEEMAGHDYWLTRNGHGTGFWDRGLGELGEALTKACQYQARHLFINEDEKLDYVWG